jgi:hypothetical protein
LRGAIEKAILALFGVNFERSNAEDIAKTNENAAEQAENTKDLAKVVGDNSDAVRITAENLHELAGQDMPAIGMWAAICSNIAGIQILEPEYFESMSHEKKLKFAKMLRSGVLNTYLTSGSESGLSAPDRLLEKLQSRMTIAQIKDVTSSIFDRVLHGSGGDDTPSASRGPS